MATSSTDEFSNTLYGAAETMSAVDGAESPTFDEEAPSLELSVNHLADIHGWFYGANGETTKLFWAQVVAQVLVAIHFWTGTVALPGVVEGVMEQDYLCIFGSTANFVLIMTCAVLMFEVRNTVDARDSGPLAQVGVGRIQITAERAKTLQKLRNMEHPKSIGMAISGYVIPTVVLVGLAVAGWGAQESRLFNRMSALFFIPGMLLLNLASGNVFTISVKSAMTVVAQQVEDVIRAVSVNSATTEEEWERSVSAPARRLVSVLRTLSEAYGKGVLLTTCMGCLFFLTLLLVWSPTTQRNIARAGVPWLGTAIATCMTSGISLMIPQFMYANISGPAEISTMCDRLDEALSTLRVEDPSAETDERVTKLKRALEGVNNGNGIGFVLLGTIVNKRMLNQIASAVVGVVVFVLPLFITLPVELDMETNQKIDALSAALSALNSSIYSTCSGD
jgi:hypothetical protein